MNLSITSLILINVAVGIIGLIFTVLVAVTIWFKSFRKKPVVEISTCNYSSCAAIHDVKKYIEGKFKDIESGIANLSNEVRLISLKVNELAFKLNEKND